MQYSIVNPMRLVTVLATIVLAFAGFAYAGPVDAPRSHKVEKAKQGTLIIAAATEIGGLRLEPGEYEVKQVNSAAGPSVKFTRYTFDPYAQEGLSPYQWDDIGEVRVTLQSLDSKAARTELVTASGSNTPIGMQIRGNRFEYLFVTA